MRPQNCILADHLVPVKGIFPDDAWEQPVNQMVPHGDTKEMGNPSSPSAAVHNPEAGIFPSKLGGRIRALTPVDWVNSATPAEAVVSERDRYSRFLYGSSLRNTQIDQGPAEVAS